MPFPTDHQCNISCDPAENIHAEVVATWADAADAPVSPDPALFRAEIARSWGELLSWEPAYEVPAPTAAPLSRVTGRPQVLCGLYVARVRVRRPAPPSP